ncbi:MAG: translation initiation factor IF-2, partial [Bacteroidota bacterium]
MAEYRLSQVARKLNVGKNTILEFLKEKGYEVDSNPNSKIPQDQYDMLARKFAESAHDKEEASELTIGGKTDDMVIKADKVVHEKSEDERILIKDNVGASEAEPEKISAKKKLDGPKVLGKIDLNKKKEEPKEEVVEPKETPEEQVAEVKEEAPKKEAAKEEAPKEEVPKEEPKKEEVKKPAAEKEKVEEEPKKEREVIKAKADSLRGLKVLDKIELPKDKPKPVASSDSNQDRKKRPRKRIQSEGGGPPNRGRSSGGGRSSDRSRTMSGRKTEELSDKEIQDKIKATLAKLSGGAGKGGTQRSKYRKDKRTAKAEAEEEKQLQAEEASKTLKVTEFISASDLASLMDVTANDVISACMSLGMFVSINQRLDAETITVIADEFGYDVDFSEAKEDTEIVEKEDDESTLADRAPIVTIMGHVDHGKTSLLDYIRDSKVTEGEAGGITQHIGAYDVMTESGKRVAFLDTPGHEAFTAMRARGAKITDVAIIVVAADDSVMPQTKEAINHAQVAGVPIVIAINKVDKPNANPEKIKEDLSNINILVEDWGGKYQCQHVSAKTGEGIDELLDKVLLEAELLELKANSEKAAVGSVVEASLDKGRGYVSTIMVQAGTLRVGDVLLAGPYFGKVKAMFDHRGQKVAEAGPSTPVQMLGLDGAPQAGDKFNVMESDREAREIATKREQILREQSIRTKKHITLDEIGRRLAIGNFKELNVIVKGDVDGSIEALSDSLLKLSTEEVQVNILHKGVGQISESDVLLASAS